MASLTFTSTTGQPPYTITHTNRTQNFTQNNVISGVPLTVSESIENNTYYSLINTKDANGCFNNVSTSPTETNLIVNDDFSAGAVSSISQYTYLSSGFNPGVYFVGNNPTWHPSMTPCKDHTTGSGNMRLVNGAETPDVDVWTQTITVKPNTTYNFSCWLQTITTSNPTKLQFSINDFALDDISFSEVKTTSSGAFITIQDCDIPTASFSAPDTVCINSTVKINNTSTNASSYSWSFCAGDAGGTVVADNIGNPGYFLNGPVFSDFVKVNGMFYVFVTNNYSGTLTRLDFGNSLLNTPTAIDLGNLGKIQIHLEGIQIVNSNGKWYTFLVGGDADHGTTPQLYKLDFGSNITNTFPIVTTYPIGNMAQPIDLYVFKDQDYFYGLTINAKNNTITKFNFTNNLDNTPTAVNLSNIGNLNYPTGINAISVNGKWYVYITNENNSSITRLDYGNSLLNTPKAVNIGNPGGQLHRPRDIYIMQSCDKLIGFVNNGDGNYNSITRLDFNNDPESMPTATDLGNFGNFNFPHSFSKIFREGNDLYSFVTNVSNNSITRVKFPGCTSSSITNSTQQDPPDISYSAPGNYSINLTIDEDLPTQTSFCKSVVVLPTPQPHPILDTFLCRGDSVKLKVSFPYGKYLWSTGSTDTAIFVKTTGSYYVNYDYYGCKGKDEFTTTVKELPVVTLAKTGLFCQNDSLLLDPGNDGVKYLWQNGETSSTIWAKKGGNYIVSVTGANKCINKDTANITMLPSPVISLADNKTICIGNSIQLNAISANAITFEWTSSPTLSATNISNPIATPSDTTKYYLKVTDANNCTGKDSITVFVVPVPTVAMQKDTLICTGSSIVLQTQATAADKYSWTPSQTLDNSAIVNPTATPEAKTTYTIKASNDGCSASGQVTVDLLPLPAITKSNDTTICIPGNAQLSASGGALYKWMPANGLSNPLIANPIATTTTTTYYKVQVTGVNRCSKIDSVLVKVLPKPVFVIEPANHILCINDSLLITAKGGDIYEWQPSNTNSSNVIVYPIATTDYKVSITNKACNLTDILTAHVQVNPLPVITMRKSNDIDCINPRANITASGGVKYNWWPAEYLDDATSISPVASVLQNTKFYVKVTNKNTCSNIDSITVNVTQDGENMFVVPNAFTPNGDGQNDCFNIKHWGENNKLIDFNIYNRWGAKIWSTTNINDCWDGTFKGRPQPSGEFVYIIHAKTICGTIERKGVVMLIR